MKAMEYSIKLWSTWGQALPCIQIQNLVHSSHLTSICKMNIRNNYMQNVKVEKIQSQIVPKSQPEIG